MTRSYRHVEESEELLTQHGFLLDNSDDRTVVGRLRQNLASARAFDIVSAYFSIYGFELLADPLDNISETRFLFGDPSSVEDLDPGAKDARAFNLTENGLSPTQILHQKSLAQRCEEWVSRRSVQVRSIRRSNFLHGKMYVTDDVAIVGSSNFTKKGLGGGVSSNLEINLAVTDADRLKELRDWFDRLWEDDQLTHDVKKEVLATLQRLGQENAPNLVYFKSLYELLKDRIDAQLANEQQLRERRLHDSVIWNTLYKFQQDGVLSIIDRLKRHNGCILADSVGLGKTYTALAVIKYFESQNQNVLVLCPNKLKENWALYPIYNGRLGNPFVDDRFGYSVLAHTDLSRDGGMSGNIDLGNFNWGAYDLVVIDESHNFRNDEGKRYQRLLEEIIKDGSKTSVLMLSATPVNTSLIDLRNQIHLMTEEKDDHFRREVGIGNVRSVMGAAQKEFKQWEESKTKLGSPQDKSALLERLGPDFLRLLDAASIARSRRQITTFYSEEMERIGQFPRHDTPTNLYPEADTQEDLSYKLLSEQIGTFTLSIYMPSNYLIDKTRQTQLDLEKEERNFNQRDREKYLVAMIRTNFLKRLESSPNSLSLTLERTIGKMDSLVERIEAFRQHQQDAVDIGDALPDEDSDDDDFQVNRARHPYHLRELDLGRWQEDIEQDRDTLSRVLERVRAITPERDGKLQNLRDAIQKRMDSPTTNSDGESNRKMLVFTTFKDTAIYLYDHLQDDAKALGIRMAMVSGDETRDNSSPTHGAADHGSRFQNILDRFAPAARRRRDAVDADQEIDLLIATDCISEGQNLQDCDTVVNYDIHWNPVRLIQRFGRIDRIGSRNPVVRMINYWPTKNMDEYLKLENRVLARMALVDTTGGGDELFSNEEELQDGTQMELTFRDQQLLRLREEILDLDDLNDNIVMSDLSMDYFLAQLRQFLEQNREMLEQTPLGSYAIAPQPSDGHGTGVIFLLRQTNAQETNVNTHHPSPVHPHYLVYIRDDGSIRFGAGSARQALTAFEGAAAGHKEPLKRLCDEFDQETKRGENMEHYNSLVNSVIAHIRQNAASAAAAGLSGAASRDFQLPRASETPRSAADFELVTWLVIK